MRHMPDLFLKYYAKNEFQIITFAQQVDCIPYTPDMTLGALHFGISKKY